MTIRKKTKKIWSKPTISKLSFKKTLGGLVPGTAESTGGTIS